MRVFHLTAGAPGALTLVRDDRERFELLDRVRGMLCERLLAHCVMDTHLHVVAEGSEEDVVDALRIAIRAYARVVNARRGSPGPLLRAPVAAVRAPGPLELVRMMRYVHENPAKTREPLVRDPVAFRWSSARAFAGLSHAGFPAVARVRKLVGSHEWRLGPTRALTDLEPVSVPSASPEVLLEAAAQTFGVLAEDVRGDGRTEPLSAARAVFAALGRVESYRDVQLAPLIRRTSQRLGQLARVADPSGVRIGRTLVRVPELRAGLEALPLGLVAYPVER